MDRPGQSRRDRSQVRIPSNGLNRHHHGGVASMADEAKPEEGRETEQPQPDAVARAATSLRSGLPQFLLLGSAARPAPGQPRAYEPRIATLSEARAAAHL